MQITPIYELFFQEEPFFRRCFLRRAGRLSRSGACPSGGSWIGAPPLDCLRNRTSLPYSAIALNIFLNAMRFASIASVVESMLIVVTLF